MSEINPNKIADQLGPEGPGYARIGSMIPAEVYNEVCAELNDALPWQPQYNRYRNQRGITVEQAFDVFAHKYSRGSQEMLTKLPAFHSLGSLVTSRLVEPLSEYFPSLTAWNVDELSAQRYKAETGILTWHRDLARHPGVIAICNITGGAVIGVRHQKEESCVVLQPGDVLALRAPGLFDASGLSEDIRPEHAVLSAGGKQGRISVTARANNNPAQPIRNFSYYNWPN
jgi:hypothetical protein